MDILSQIVTVDKDMQSMLSISNFTVNRLQYINI